MPACPGCPGKKAIKQISCMCMCGWICLSVRALNLHTYVSSQYRMLPLICSPVLMDVTTSLRCCISYTAFRSRDEWNSRPHVLYTLSSTYLTVDIHLFSECGCCLLRSSTDRTLTVPQTHNRFGGRSFADVGPCLWNSLPINMQQMISYDI